MVDDGEVLVTADFQSYNSTIQTVDSATCSCSVISFQSYNSTIQTCYQNLVGMVILSFNPIIVRFKLNSPRLHIGLHTTFNPIIVRFKPPYQAGFSARILYSCLYCKGQSPIVYLLYKCWMLLYYIIRCTLLSAPCLFPKPCRIIYRVYYNRILFLIYNM